MATQVADVFYRDCGSRGSGAVHGVRRQLSRVRRTRQIQLDVVNPRAVSYLASAPGSLGFARAYIMGDLELHGDVYTALRVLHQPVGVPTWAWRRSSTWHASSGSPAVKRAPRPPQEARMQRPPALAGT